MPGHRVKHTFIFYQTKSNHCYLYDVDDDDKRSKNWSEHVIRTEKEMSKEKNYLQ
jgi:hypothetical protein